MSISQYNPGQELASIDFESMIGGPLISVVNAQAQASMSSVEFIQKVGFTEDKDPIYVSFKYPKQVAPYQEGDIGKVISIALSTAGSDYETAPTVKITDVDGSGATATAYLNASGGVDRVEIDNPGSGYSSATNIEFIGGTAVSGGTIVEPVATATIGSQAAEPAQFQEMKIEVPI